jgi:hypothetical protein
MDPDVAAEMASGQKVSQLLPFPYPYDARITNRMQDGSHILYSGGLGMSYYWDIRFANDEYSWVDIDACGGYEVTSYKTPLWPRMMGYAEQVLEPHLRRHRRRIRHESRESSTPTQ